MYHKLTISLFLVLFVSLSAVSQDTTKITWRDRLFGGGAFGLQIGTITSIEVSPQVGYRLTSRLAGGMGIKYEFLKDSREPFPYKTHIYGGSVFSSLVLWKDMLSEGTSLMAHIEDEVLSLDKKYFYDGSSGRFALNSFLVGGGIRQRIGRRSYYNILILWNLNQTNLSPNQNPVFKLTFQF